jgi:hypothetical protein
MKHPKKTKYYPGCEPLPTVVVPAQPGWSVLHHDTFEDGTLVKTPVVVWEVVDVIDIDHIDSATQAFPITHNAWANTCYRHHEGVLCDPNGAVSHILEFFRDEAKALDYIKDVIKRREAENAKRNAVEAAS